MRTWPSDLPYRPIAGSFSGEPFRSPLMTEMDDGPIRSRRRTTLNVVTISFRIRLTKAQFADFKTWVRDALVDGVLPFTMPIWDGSEYIEKRCKFRKPYGLDPAGGFFVDVTLELDVEDY